MYNIFSHLQIGENPKLCLILSQNQALVSMQIHERWSVYTWSDLAEVQIRSDTNLTVIIFVLEIVLSATLYF